MGIFKKRANIEEQTAVVQTSRNSFDSFSILNSYTPLSTPQVKLYEALREGVPVIDAAIGKIIRLIGGFEIICMDKSSQKDMNEFVANVKVGASSNGVESFICSYMDSLLVYGNAVGEIVMDKGMSNILGLYNASVEDIEVKKGSTPIDVDIYVNQNGVEKSIIKNKELVMFTALNPKPSEVCGVSLLRSLPFVASILMRIFSCIGQNFERVGNVRYAVTYKPSNDGMDRAYAKERANAIAREWSQGMASTKNGNVKDFISVGDVNIKVIGADNQIIDTDVPVRQMLEQIVAKLSLPPFLLGLSWSTTERMSKQQSDILTSELQYYRRLLTPIIKKICDTYLRINGYKTGVDVKWSVINLLDEVEHSRAMLYHAQAQQLSNNNK